MIGERGPLARFSRRPAADGFLKLTLLTPHWICKHAGSNKYETGCQTDASATRPRKRLLVLFCRNNSVELPGCAPVRIDVLDGALQRLICGDG
jgi:hypothetical protein